MLLRLLPLFAAAIGCAPTSAPASSQTTAPKTTPRAISAREVARGDHPWAAEDRRIPPGKERFSGELFAELPFPSGSNAIQRLSRDAIAYLDMPPGQYMGSRVLATRERVHTILEPNDLVRLCVARDGRTTFAVQQGNKLLTASSIDAPMRSLGSIEREVAGAYFVLDEGKRSFVDCRRGLIEDISKIRGYPNILFHSETLTLLTFDDDQRRTCRLRTIAGATWEDLPRCSYASLYEDGLVRIYALTPDSSTTKCALAIDVEGKRRPCGPDAEIYRAPPYERPIDFRLARFVSPNLLAAVGEKGLYLMPAAGTRAELKLIAPGNCVPVTSISPVFQCMSDDRRTARIVAIDMDGKPRDELTLKVRAGWSATFFETAGGALAMGGACDGTLGDAACVRQPGGAWKSIPFAADLVKELHKSAPGTMVLPAVSGDLYIGAGISDKMPSPVDFAIYKADSGLVTRALKIPRWITGEAAGPSSFAKGYIFIGASDPGFLWRSATTFSAWPLRRAHPAFRTPESCRLDISLEGSIHVACVSGNVHSAGRFGVVEKKRGELLETYDGGATWTPVLLPEGVDTGDVDCAAIGCRIGPYFRLGWGL